MRKAIKLVNYGSTIIYSTCSILKDENEKIIEKVKDLVEVETIEKNKYDNIKFLESLSGTLTICPNEYFEGFFIAKLKKIKKM